ncbi:uncharacterized protein LOC126369485 isoform X2 [Pectinophora gossypiella]|uniref:uncharacterized protein LOC126369485 isoform X2 n=1 Tax=Pectinophora gossypiella TaxID=13191 RepID=UPI00214DF492|nr:uncharacterized protein LOC126369485 isoform X2 [Pectinophora gossypiella]
MSGKPASVAATRAGAPRVLVYVADPRQLEPGAAGSEAPPPPPPPVPLSAAPVQPLDALFLHDNSTQHLSLPRNTVYRTQIEQNDQRNLPNTIFYKSFNDNDSKLGAFGPTDNTVVQRSEFFPVSQQFLKETTIKIEENKVNDRLANVKRDCSNQFGTEYGNIETYRIPTDTGDPSTYQARCNGPVSDNIMPSMQSITLQQGQNQFESCTVQSEGTSCSEKDLSVGKSYVNYQFLEQSVSHQSIVNQSISILNQQVGVSRGVVSEGDNGSGPQLVRTADGVVLAVLPSSVLPHSAEAPDLASRTAQSDSPQTIIVPLGWRRIVSGSSVLYVSPSGTALSTLPQLREYLQTAGTCKCGLPCPLRPEITFNFDPKVVSKPYQAASGAELTKLCNHKRKLLANLQARAHSPATPPPLDQKKAPGTEVGMLKKKMKKRPGFPPNMSVSQLMVQRERPLNDFKPQDGEHNRTMSPGVSVRPNNQNCLPNFAPGQHMSNTMTQDNEVKQETHIQRTSHYLTVNSGWITQQENLDAIQKANQNAAGSPNTLNVGMPVLGTNGQIIGVNTGFNKQNNFKNTMNIHGHSMPSHLEHEMKDDKKEMSNQQNMLSLKQPNKEEESQIFCGLNQPLTPEVMQKINEQQQIFIQQNQKQIEMAMKGFRTQLAENINQNKPLTQNQYLPQAQLVIQNGTVVKTNPAKTPPWQVKRNEPNTNSLTSPSPKPQKIDNMDFEDSNTHNHNMSEDSPGSYSPFPNNEQSMNQSMCSRVPPLPQHYNMLSQQWPNVDMNKKKVKANNKGGRKKASPTENKLVTFGNHGVRMLQDSKCDDMPNNNVPSFMDDPSGYLAQQTVLLNNTISKQVGINSSFDGNQYENSNNCFVQQNQGDRSCKQMTKSCEIPNVYRNNMVPNPSPSPNNTPDSSVLSDKTAEPCCKGCNVSMKGNSDFPDNQMRLKYMKPNVYKLELDGSATSSPRHGFEDNPVTSSTFIDRSPMMNESCGPIQAGTVSTSNVSPPETLQPPEPSPTLSNSSRNTDTPHSSGSNSSQLPPNCTFPMPSPAYSNPGSCKDNFNSNPSTPGSNQPYPYNSPGPPNSQITGTQMMHFISNHNVNKNLMEVDNISMVGVKPVLKTPNDLYRCDNRKKIENSMPGYCPPPHLGGGPAHSLIQACYVQTFVTTMASGFSVTRDTVTSVLAGKANTCTTSINASQANFIRPPPPPSVNLATTYAIPTNQPDPFINSVNLPTSYPLHIAGPTAQNMISKSPLEIAQNIIGSMPSKPDSHNTQTNTMPARRQPTTPGQILISSTGQIIVSNNQMPPPPPKTTTAMSPMQGSNVGTHVTTSVTQVMPAVGGVQPMVNQSTVVVNALPAPFVIQPPMMAVDGQVVQQNTILPQIVTGVVSGQSPNDTTHRQIDVKNSQSFVQGVAMLSPESLKKRSKKKKGQTANITNVLQITAPQQNPNNIMVHSSPQNNSSPQFSPRGFQLSPNNNISPTPMLQALTIVPGKSGTPAHIVMNGQGNTNNFGSQQIITNTSPSQQINLLQPVNLINNASGVVPNFPSFQQFIVPNLGGMVMTADGTAIIQDNSTGMPMQLQLQTVNGQNVLTPVQNPGVFAAGANGGVVIRAQNQQGKIIQSQHSPGAQFLSPNSQVMMNSPNFNGQLSPLLANLSPTNVTFNTSPHQVRSSNVQTQEFIQTNQMGQTLMVPLSPKQVSLASATNSRNNSTFVQQNTTIVQQQTTLVSNSHNTQMSSISTNIQGGNPTRLSIDPNVLLSKQMSNVQKTRFIEMPVETNQIEDKVVEKNQVALNQIQLSENDVKLDNPEGYVKFMNEFGGMLGQPLGAHVRHSVSTQTLAQQRGARSPSRAAAAGSPPDTTTHSPLGALERARSPRLPAASALGNYADTTTSSPEPADANSSAMVQCVSSSEQDMAEAREHAWAAPRAEFPTDTDTQNIMSNIPLMRQNRTPNPVETTEMHYNQGMVQPAGNNPHMMPVSSNYYDRSQAYKRKNDFGDGSTYRTDKIMRTNNGMVHGIPKESDFDMAMNQDKGQPRHFSSSGSSSDASMKVFDRHNLGSGDGVEN